MLRINLVRGYLHIPGSVHCVACKHCGATPIIVPVDDIGYSVKCPDNDSHYHTPPGIIDIESWNYHNNSINVPVPAFDPAPLFAW